MPGAEADLDLLTAAARVRDAGLASAGRPGVVTYSKKVFIPLTRLCRDRCHYCTFATVPGRLPAPYLSVEEVLDIARQGAALGCKEALFTLGDRPEDRWPEARAWLDEQGYESTLAYVRAMAVRVLEETGLLPHLNPGVMSWEELNRLKPVSPSMGMMLETTARVILAASCSGLRTGIAAIVVQLGLAMIPLGRLATSSGLTSLTTSGTSGSRRQAEELSITTAPAAATRGANSREVPPPAEKIAISSPAKSAVAVSSTTTSLSPEPLFHDNFWPAERAEAKNRTSSAGK